MSPFRPTEARASAEMTYMVRVPTEGAVTSVGVPEGVTILSIGGGQL